MTPTPAGGFRRGDWRAEAITEEALQSAVLACARALGYRCHHAWTQLHSAAGYPDATLVRADPPRLVFFEFKSARGQVTPDQAAWLAELASVPGVTALLVRPEDWLDGSIERVLRGEEGTDAGQD